MTSVSSSIGQRRPAPAWNPWQRARRLLLLIGLAVPPAPALSQVQVAPPTPRPFIMAADVQPDAYLYKWVRLVYAEAFRRLGIPLELVTHTLARRSALVEEGAIDGEAARIYAYADAHPELVRVEESVMDFTFSIFSANPNLRARTLEELPADALVEHRRGILLCENTLKKSISPERLSNVVNSEQGVKKLLAGRTDAYCDIDLYVREALNSRELRGVTSVRKLFDIASVPTYPYLYKKHAGLAPRLAATLKQMKAEGLLAAYLKQAERESGWPQ